MTVEHYRYGEESMGLGAENGQRRITKGPPKKLTDY